MTQGRTYAVTFAAVAVSAAQDLVEISPADDKPVELIGIHIGQTSDAGDAQDEQLQITVIRGHSTSGSGGTSATPQPLNVGDAAAGFAAEVNNTTVASAGTAVTLFASAFNVRAGADIYLPEDVRPRAKQGDGTMVVRISAPADALTASGVAWFREF
ncbi:MAG: hypothetical protein EKK62_11655 [Acidimicrobiia bacterium]|nr:MAG: hypothetical protein EKK62_11655 [Acidimicrobiia bacterium]